MRSKHKPEGKKVKLSGTDRNTPARLQQSRFSPFRVPNIVLSRSSSSRISIFPPFLTCVDLQ